MERSKLKNIIIVILLALNLCLLALIVNQQMRSRNYNEETLLRTIEVLKKNGIEVSRENLPEQDRLHSMVMTWDEEKETAAARFLLGEEAISSYSGGMSIHSSVKGNLSFYGGSMTGSLELPWSGYETQQDHAAAILKGMGIEVWKIESEEMAVTAIPAMNGIPVFNAKIAFTYEGELLKRLEGRFPGVTVQEKEQQEAVAMPTALVSLLEHVMESGTVCRSVKNIERGYFLSSTGADSARIAQCWFVETDTVPFYIDAATGNVTRAD